jgi:homogentisate 1,2-dioxygenase
MLERQSRGRLPDAPHTQLKAPDGRLLYEHCITRQGFDGPYTIAYHEQRPHEAQPALDAPVILPPAGTFPERLLRRHYQSPQSALALEPFPRHRGRLLENADVALSIALPTRSDAAYFANSDGDELYFVHSGSGTLRTQLGDVAYRAGDYVYVPRSLLHRFVLDAGSTQYWLILELRNPLSLPSSYRNSVGQLRMDAPYSHRDFRAPAHSGPRDEGLRDFWLKTQGTLQKYSLSASPLDVVGWDGSLYPFALSIDAFKPKVGKVHLPPPVHATFEAPGVLICSFVPRPLDFHEQAVPCPYPHSSVDVDEVLFYSRGNFTSRRGVGPGSISHHPRGIPHGPHPGAYEASVGAKYTDEVAVMLDCTQPLTRSALAESLEDTAYHGSFVASAGSHSTG